jgi:hypothetical protein
MLGFLKILVKMITTHRCDILKQQCVILSFKISSRVHIMRLNISCPGLALYFPPIRVMFLLHIQKREIHILNCLWGVIRVGLL